MSQKLPKTPTRFLVALAPLLLVLAACGDSDDTSSSDTVASAATDIQRLTIDGSTFL
jgi:ABC-type phosphate transport system substrate-binding protein